MYEIMCFDEYGNSIEEFVQWDINRVMYIDWEHSCTPIFQFGNTKSDRLLVVKGRIIEDETKTIAEVNVPNILLQQPYPIIGFVYLENEVDGNEGYFAGKTIYNFKIPVRAKKKPEDYKYQENTEYISWINLEAQAKAYLAELEVETNRFKEEYKDALGDAKENAERAIQAAEEAKVSEDNAKDSENNAKTSEEAAKLSEIASKTSEEVAKNSEDNAHDSEVAAKQSEENALSSESNAKASENAAKLSETSAKISEVNAKESEENALRSETKAKESEEKANVSESNARVSEANTKISETNAKNNADRAEVSANEAVEFATNANDSAVLSKSYAVGETNTRTDEDIDNAKYYYSQAKAISDNLGGVFSPQGTIEFLELQSVTKSVGYVYHISDDFVTDDTFRCGAGISYPAGTNVYYTSDGNWDCFVDNIKTLVVTDDDNGNVTIKYSSDSITTDEQYDVLNQTIVELRERIKTLENQNVLEVVE